MADKNYKSYERRIGEHLDVGLLRPANPSEWNDTMKTFECVGCVFRLGDIYGGTEDAIDIGTHSDGNIFSEFVIRGGRYCITLKSNSNGNKLNKFIVKKHGSRCDIQQGNWSDQDNGSNSNNVYEDWVAEDGEPITYSYRLFCNSKPKFVNTKTKHLWWLSIGITVYFWAKWIGRKVGLA